MAVAHFVRGGYKLADFGGRVVRRDRVRAVARQILPGCLRQVSGTQSPTKGMAQIVYAHVLEAPRRNAGTGLSAKCEETGGIDLVVFCSAGRYRTAGRGSVVDLLSHGYANDIVVDMAREVQPAGKHTPVLAGGNGTDPFVSMGTATSEQKLEEDFNRIVSTLKKPWQPIYRHA